MRLRWAVLWLRMTATLALAGAAVASPLPSDPLERECWLSTSRERTRVNLREPTAVAFANLRRQARVRSPFQVDFAVRGMGVAPAGQAVQGTGHHHILVNTPLPLDVQAKIPFSDTHRHFGKGQTGTTLDLPPGRHTLRLLFANHEHRPYFVFSPEVEVTVTGPRTASPLPIRREQFQADCAAWYEDELTRPRPPGPSVSVLNLRDGEPVVSPFNLQFGVDGFGVGAAGQAAEGTGFFILDVRQDGQLAGTTTLADGATQTNLWLPPGAYRLSLRFVGAQTRADLLPAAEINIVVTALERL